jgi:hypothetical protein
MEVVMRNHHVIAVGVVLIFGLVAKQFFFPPRMAEADPRSSTLNIMQMHVERPNLPAQKMQDMTFVFDSE